MVALQANGAEGIFLDLTSSGSDDRVQDPDFQNAIAQSDKVFVVGRIVSDRGQETILFPELGVFGTSSRVIAAEREDFLGFVWNVPTKVESEGVLYDTFAGKLVGDASTSRPHIEIDYRFDPGEFPVVSLSELEKYVASAEGIEGKSFVFGFATAGKGTAVSLPGSRSVSRSFVAIFAAETAWNGDFTRISIVNIYHLPLLIVCTILVVLGIFGQPRTRHFFYGLAPLSIAATFVSAIFLPFRTGLSTALIFLFVFSLQCMFARWRAQANLDSADTGLPSLKRLELDISGLPPTDRKVLISAKIHNFAEVMAALPAASRADYFEGVVKRLRVGDTSLTIYSNAGDRLLWMQDFESQETLRSHLIALLAIFKNPLRIGEKPIDIAITFGVDLNFIGEGHRRISIAEALTEKTSLSAQPIVFGDETDTTDDEWRVSLQSKIDNALQSDEIFPVFQPQVDLRDRRIVGFEGLVRWNDRERGFISPSYFVEQCEQAGRMEKLQKFMLEECISKFSASNAIDTDAWLSINVSATLLADTWLTELVHRTLEETGFPASRLVLEITETARIHDPRTAGAVLSALSDLGVELSLDDFGTGTAGLESFYHLPFDELKVDRLFTAALTKSKKARAIVKHAIKLGNDLGIRVICEGVEDEETAKILESMGCDFAQGYLFGKPFHDLDSFEYSGLEWLKSN
ncbi:EAL domain-containing protein [Qipengyuania sp. DGS5-3]|uniref:EAL domain-containing protein n=1 Tax=Qipengyuania sp. DGS5-3 TaxID=3349632 RepID=UPI0036D36797